VEATPAEPEPAAEPVAVEEPEPAPEPEPAVSERSTRAILATGPPPVSEPPRSAPKARVEPRPEREPDPEPEPAADEAPREWSIWELQRRIRDLPEDARQEEWAALAHSLRDFARADGTLPAEFDGLVRDSFGPILTAETETVAAP
jgi:hypothetical protein